MPMLAGVERGSAHHPKYRARSPVSSERDEAWHALLEAASGYFQRVERKALQLVGLSDSARGLPQLLSEAPLHGCFNYAWVENALWRGAPSGGP